MIPELYKEIIEVIEKEYKTFTFALPKQILSAFIAWTHGN